MARQVQARLIASSRPAIPPILTTHTLSGLNEGMVNKASIRSDLYHSLAPSVEDLSSPRVCLKLGLPDRQVVGPIIGRAGGMTMKA